MQIIGYKWKSNPWEPFFLVKDNEKIKRMPLLGQNILLSLGERFCVGYFSDGKHHECPNKERLDFGYHCSLCKTRDDFFGCVQCNGFCKNEKQRQACVENSYFIYLAAFDSLLKVGISQENRFFQRLIEQGADFAAKVALIKDGLIARRTEQDIRTSLNIADRISGKEKHETLFGNPNIAIRNLVRAIAMLKDRFDFVPEIYDFRRHYKLENVLSRPRRFEINDNSHISGKIIAAKGNIIILHNYFYYSIDANEIVGREIKY